MPVLYQTNSGRVHCKSDGRNGHYCCSPGTKRVPPNKGYIEHAQQHNTEYKGEPGKRDAGDFVLLVTYSECVHIIAIQFRAQLLAKPHYVRL